MKTRTKNISMLLIGIIIIFQAVLLAGCNKKVTTDPNSESDRTSDESTLTLAMINEPTGFDPFIADSADTRSILFNIFEGLVKPTEDGGLTPAVAEDYKISDDATTYTFILRSGIKFHNGNPVTLDDVIYSVNQAIEAKISGYENISAVEPVDDKTIKIQLKEADNEFLPYLTTAIVPKDYTEQATKPIGTGPYKIDIAHYDGNENTIRLIRNESWWGGELYIDSILAKVYENNDASRTAFLEGQVDLVDTMVIYANTVWNRNNVEYHKYLTTEFEFLALNNSKSLFQDKTIKHAMAYAIDRKDIISKVYINNAETVDVPIPSTSWLYDSNYRIYDFEVDKARKLLYDAGWKDSDADGVLDKHIDGKKVDLSFSLLTNEENNSRRDVAELISNQLSLLGFQVNVEIEPWDIILEEKIPNGEFDVILTGYNMHPANDLRFLFHSDEIGKGLNNFIRYKSSELDRLLDNASRSFTEEERLKAYQRIQEHITNELPIISLYFKTGTLLTDTRVRGIDRLINFDIYKDIESWFLIR